ncbi:Phospholipase/carboxylesterase/thioesterase [Penicillium longicatenatum]|nr:Phospholipase/carboxylesterase/thioesterase [Penicillium longicatenatum]
MPQNAYPAPLVIPPFHNDHTHTIIALHGRGSNALRTELQIDGLCETAGFIRDLITKEAHILGEGGYRKIILWGLSQGCAAGIFTILGGWYDMSEANTLGEFVGMSGWLPFEQHLREILRCDDKPELADISDIKTQSDTHDANYHDASEAGMASDEDSEKDDFLRFELEDDPFQRPGQVHDDFNPFTEDTEVKVPVPIQAIDYIRDMLDLPMLTKDEEPQSPSNLCQLQTGINVTWKSYEGLGHWYRVEDEIQDILKFLESHAGIPVEHGFPVPS